jgi:hypothetical protein
VAVKRFTVIAGLDPAIHPSSRDSFDCPLTRTMDGRVKPGHDENEIQRCD